MRHGRSGTSGVTTGTGAMPARARALVRSPSADERRAKAASPAPRANPRVRKSRRFFMSFLFLPNELEVETRGLEGNARSTELCREATSAGTGNRSLDA